MRRATHEEADRGGRPVTMRRVKRERGPPTEGPCQEADRATYRRTPT